MNEHRIIIGLLVILVKYLVKELTHKELQIVLKAENFIKDNTDEI